MLYREFLESMDMDDDQLHHVMDTLPEPVYNAYEFIQPMFSKIEGIGLSPTRYFVEGDKVMTLLEAGVRQMGSRYTNHSDNPNVKAVVRGNDLIAVALRTIDGSEEITICYSENIKASKKYGEMFLNKQERSMA